MQYRWWPVARSSARCASADRYCCGFCFDGEGWMQNWSWAARARSTRPGSHTRGSSSTRCRSTMPPTCATTTAVSVSTCPAFDRRRPVQQDVADDLPGVSVDELQSVVLRFGLDDPPVPTIIDEASWVGLLAWAQAHNLVGQL